MSASAGNTLMRSGPTVAGGNRGRTADVFAGELRGFAHIDHDDVAFLDEIMGILRGDGLEGRGHGCFFRGLQ